MQRLEGLDVKNEESCSDIPLFITTTLANPVAQTKTKGLKFVWLTCWLQMHRAPQWVPRAQQIPFCVLQGHKSSLHGWWSSHDVKELSSNRQTGRKLLPCWPGVRWSHTLRRERQQGRGGKTKREMDVERFMNGDTRGSLERETSRDVSVFCKHGFGVIWVKPQPGPPVLPLDTWDTSSVYIWTFVDNSELLCAFFECWQGERNSCCYCWRLGLQLTVIFNIDEPRTLSQSIRRCLFIQP